MTFATLRDYAASLGFALTEEPPGTWVLQHPQAVWVYYTTDDPERLYAFLHGVSYARALAKTVS